MIRKAIQRLGVGYLLMLPSMAFLGFSLDLIARLFSHLLDPFTYEVLGRSFTDTSSGLLSLMLSNHYTNLCLTVTTWAVGAWLLLHPAEPVTEHRYWRIVFGVCSAAFLPVFLLLLAIAGTMQMFLGIGEECIDSDTVAYVLQAMIIVTFSACVISIFRLRASR